MRTRLRTLQALPASRRGDRRGFTLIELLIVILLIGALAAILLPNMQRARFRAQAAEVASKLEALNVAVKAYETDHGDAPVGTGPSGAPPAWLAPYAEVRLFNGPMGITYQLNITTGQPPTVVASAGPDPGQQQVLLAAAGILGDVAFVVGGGATLVASLTH